MTPQLSGSLLNWVFLSVLSLDPSYLFYTRLVFLPFSQIIRLSAIFLLTMFSHNNVCGPPSAQILLARHIDALSQDLHLWMSSNRLPLNSSKTQLRPILFGIRQQLLKLDYTLLSEKFPHFTFLSSVRHLGVTLDSSITFTEHISKLTRSSYYQLRRLRAIRRSVSSSTFTSIVHAFVCSRIDYCSALHVGLPKVRLSPLQSVLNAAARLIARLPRLSHISIFMSEQLHWLYTSLCAHPIQSLFSCSNINGLAPKYLCHQILRPSLPRQSVLSDRLTGLTFLFSVLGPQCLNPDPLCA